MLTARASLGRPPLICPRTSRVTPAARISPRSYLSVPQPLAVEDPDEGSLEGAALVEPSERSSARRGQVSPDHRYTTRDTARDTARDTTSDSSTRETRSRL